jgi:dUTP pyrophosphatase
MIKIKVVNLSSTLKLPEYATDGSAAMDLKACFDCGEPIKHYWPLNLNGFHREDSALLHINIDDRFILEPGNRCVIPTGLRIELPKGYKFSIISRSGLAVKSGIFVLNGTGLIDEDYRGTMGIILGNFGNVAVPINHGDRLAQGFIEKVERWKWKESASLSDTKRGTGGFGSTGV